MRTPILGLVGLLSILLTTTATPCNPRAWIRAPDLAPGMITQASARLSLNGTAGCEIKEWGVGLRMKERGIFKFHAANVTIPSRPLFDHQAPDDDDESIDSREPRDIFSSHASLRGPHNARWEAYQQQVKVYEESMAARDLWTSRSAERTVFDSRVSLPVDGLEEHVKGSNRILLREFRVNVPSTNFPYMIDRAIHFSSDEQDVSTVESMFEYYFLLTFADGSVVDVPAGKTAFLPAASAEMKDSVDEEETIKEMDLSEMKRMGSSPPECDQNRNSTFKVDLALPPSGTLRAGTTHLLNLTLHQSGTSSQFPTRVSAHIETCTTDTWTSTYAFDDAHRRVVSSCHDTENHARSGIWGRDVSDRVRMTRREETYAGDMHPRSGIRERWIGDVSGSRMNGQPTILSRSDSQQTVLVNLTIPSDIAYTANRTLQNSETTLVITLDTSYGCEHSDTADPARELTDDEMWSPWWRERAATHPKTSHRWTAGLRVPVAPPQERTWTSPTPLLDYQDPAARAIVLTAPNVPPLTDDAFPLVDTSVRESSDDLQRSKYDVWSRMPTCRGMGGRCGHGIGDGLVGEVWARYQWRNAKSEVSQGAQTKTASQDSQVVLQ